MFINKYKLQDSKFKIGNRSKTKKEMQSVKYFLKNVLTSRNRNEEILFGQNTKRGRYRVEIGMGKDGVFRSGSQRYLIERLKESERVEECGGVFLRIKGREKVFGAFCSERMQRSG